MRTLKRWLKTLYLWCGGVDLSTASVPRKWVPENSPYSVQCCRCKGLLGLDGKVIRTCNPIPWERIMCAATPDEIEALALKHGWVVTSTRVNPPQKSAPAWLKNALEGLVVPNHRCPLCVRELAWGKSDSTDSGAIVKWGGDL